jgi:hypothetical protein
MIFNGLPEAIRFFRGYISTLAFPEDATQRLLLLRHQNDAAMSP